MSFWRLTGMAWRNLWRNPRRTAITLSSIALGMFLAIFFTGFQDSNFSDMIDVAARLGGGHVTLQHPEYLDTPTLSRTVASGPLRDRALRDPQVERVVPRITGQLMLSTSGQNYGGGFIAYDPALEDIETLSLLDAVDEGEVFASSEDKGILIGHKLADNLDAKLGRKIVYTLTDRHGEIVRDVARVSGIIKTGSPTVDGGLAMFPIDRMRQVLDYAPDEAVQVALFLDDQRSADEVAARLGPAVNASAAALAWHQVQPDLAGFIYMKVAGAIFMELIIMLLIAAGIFNTLFVGVMERIREFGIMLALGWSPGKLFSLVMLESGWLALVGLVVGAVVTAWPYYYMATTGFDVVSAAGIEGAEIAGVGMTTHMYVGIFPENLALIVIAVLSATLLSGVYPAWRAGRVEPVDSIRLV